MNLKRKKMNEDLMSPVYLFKEKVYKILKAKINYLNKIKLLKINFDLNLNFHLLSFLPNIKIEFYCTTFQRYPTKFDFSFIKSFLMQTFNKHDIMEAQTTREKKKALKFLKEAFETQKNTLEEVKVKKKHELQKIVSGMRVKRMMDGFYKKITMNNIYQTPCHIQLLSQKQKDQKRMIKWKGFKVPQKLLSIIYVLEIVFLVITFYISSCMAFLDNFVQSNTHNSALVFFLNAVTLLFSFIKILITSTSQKMKSGILLTYVTDIFIDYAESLILFVDLIYLFIMIALFIVRKGAAHLIQELSIILFVWSIVRIFVSSDNLILFRTTFINSFKKQQYYKLFQVIIFNFIFAHFIASMLIAMTQIDSLQNWMVTKNIQHEHWYVQYMWSYYWATTTMMTVGFGDFTPVTYKEGFIVSFLEFFSCIVLAYNISQIGGVISTIRSSQNEYIAKIAVFKRMAQQNQIDLELKIRIQGFLRQQKEIKETFEFNQQNQLLQSLPVPLKRQFIMASNGKIFKYLPFFKNLQKNTLIALAQTFTSKVYYPGQILCKANDYNDCIMILKQGDVGLAYRRRDSALNGIIVQEVQIKDRQFLTHEGQFETSKVPVLLTVQFLTPGKIINYDMTAVTYSYVFQLNQEEFLKIVKTSDIDTEYFFSITHLQSSSGSQWQQLPCRNCENILPAQGYYSLSGLTETPIEKQQNKKKYYYHTKFECPKLHYLPLKGVVILKFLTTRGQVQKRKPKFNRKKIRSESCLLLRKNAFKTYEKKRFINEKKQFEKLVEKSLSLRSKKLSKKQKKANANVKNNKKIRMNSEGSIQLSQRKISFEDQMFVSNLQNNEAHKQSDELFFQNEVSSEEDQKTVIQSVIKYALQEANQPKHISMDFWDCQIDILTNYFNYFPQDNSARLDNLELCKDKAHKNKALCMIGQMLKMKNLMELNKKETQRKNERKYPKEKENQPNNLAAIFGLLLKNQNVTQKQPNSQKKEGDEMRYQKVYPAQGFDEINEEKRKYQERYTKFTYQFPKQERVIANPPLKSGSQVKSIKKTDSENKSNRNDFQSNQGGQIKRLL